MAGFEKGKKYDVVDAEQGDCVWCCFLGNSACEVWRKYPCGPKLRKDNKNVIFEEVKKQSV